MAENLYTYSDMHRGLNINSRGDVEVLYDTDAIEQSIRCILATVSGERVRNPLGSTMVGLLFQPLNSRTAEGVKDEIFRVIGLFEPRIRIRTIIVEPQIDTQTYDFQLEYEIVGLTGRFNFDAKLKSFGA